MKTYNYHNSNNNRNNQRFTPYPKFPHPTKVIPSNEDTRIISNSEIIITKIGAESNNFVVNKDIFEKKLNEKEDQINKREQSVLKANEWLNKTRIETCSMSKPKMRFKKKNRLTYENKRVCFIFSLILNNYIFFF